MDRGAVIGFLTGVGSRDITGDEFEVLAQCAHMQTDRGYCWRSGGAAGSDEAIHQGAQRSIRFKQIGVEIFLPWRVFRRDGLPELVADPTQGIYDASQFPNWQEANEIALKARGSWEGLGRGGIALHTRNAYQFLGRSLCLPSDSLLCCATPIGKKGNVKGGTNTAVQLANKHNVRVINIRVEQQRRLVEDLIRNHTFLKA